MPLTKAERKLQLTVALVGVAGALFGSLIGGTVAVAVQYLQFEQDEDAEARAVRAKAYADFLDSANAVAASVTAMRACLPELLELPEKETTLSASHPCARAYNTLVNDRYEFQGAINDVYIYGSDDAVQAANRVSELLPARFRADEEDGYGPRIDPISWPDFDRAYIAFQTEMCREVSVRPRKACA
jgi:hypothetical protein